jgi:DNA-binding CsgD family transcriptional regulator
LEKEDMHQFLYNLSNSLNKEMMDKSGYDDYRNYNLQPNECIYVLDFFDNSLIYCKGFQNTWGYEDHEITYELVIDNIHPNDKEVVHTIGKMALMHSQKNGENKKNDMLTLTYRCKKKDGSYTKYLSQSNVAKTDDDGAVTGVLIKLTDISFLDNSDHVFWDFKSDGLDKEDFRKKIYAHELNNFTKRELAIMHLIKKNLTNKEISSELEISELTVSTHRKNIMRKSGCHNVQDLLVFCSNKGIL